MRVATSLWGVKYSAADTSRIDVCDPNGAPVGFIDFTKEFKYLGSIVHYSLQKPTSTSG